jgi:WD40 repeat protein
LSFAETGRVRRRLEGHSDGVYCVSFDSTSVMVASGSSDKIVRVWNVESGDLQVSINCSSGASRLSCHPFRSHVAAATSKGVVFRYDIWKHRNMDLLLKADHLLFSRGYKKRIDVNQIIF